MYEDRGLTFLDFLAGVGGLMQLVLFIAKILNRCYHQTQLDLVAEIFRERKQHLTIQRPILK